MKIIFATSNKHKLKEVQLLFPSSIEIVSLSDIGFHDEIEETGATIPENSMLKAKTIFDKYKLPVFAEDTGLEVDALNGAPGVYSARFAGPNCDANDNMNLLLDKLDNSDNRRAQFRTVATFISDSTSIIKEGVIIGEILEERTGKDGFGYDPIFRPAGFRKSFAEMTDIEKSLISHRGIAMKKLIRALKELYLEPKNIGD